MAGKGLARAFNIADLRRLARRRLPGPVLDYLEGGADDELTLAANTDAFAGHHLAPRYLVDVAKVSTKTRVLGCDLALPLILAPTGMSRLFHPDGEIAVASAAAAAGLLYTLSTVSTVSIEDVAAVAGPRMFQIYVLRDRALNAEFIARCRNAGYAALCLTIDLPVAGNRERDLRSGMTLPLRLTPRSLAKLAAHPRWLWHAASGPRFELANVAHKKAALGAGKNSLVRYVNSQFDQSVTWDDAAAMIADWAGPFAVKGILSVADARRAVEIGATALVVSNHGGRQLDGVPPTIDLIAEIRDAVGDKIEIILDGGVRRGTHVLKALAMGATACMIGRPYLYGLAAGGAAGVTRALDIFRSEIERDLRLLGCTDVAALSRDFMRRA